MACAALLAAVLVGALAFTSVHAQDFSASELNRRMVERRTVDAVIWGLPLVSEDAVKQAAFRDGKANYNDIVWWPKGGGLKNQSLTLVTPNRLTRTRSQRHADVAYVVSLNLCHGSGSLFCLSSL